MTDDRSPIDDELVSAVLDGEATEAERALVEGSVEGRARLAELRAAAEAVATPPSALDARTIDTLVGRALDAAPPARSTSTAEVIGAAEVAARRDRRRSTAPRWRHGVTWAAAAVAGVVLVGGLAVVAGRSVRGSDSDMASESSAALDDDAGGSTASDQATGAPPAQNGDRAAAERQPSDLGPLPDAASVVSSWLALVEADPGVRNQLDQLARAESTSDPLPESGSPDLTCPTPPVVAQPGEVWAVVAVAVLPSGPVVVQADTATGGPGRVVVVDPATCEVLATRP